MSSPDSLKVVQKYLQVLGIDPEATLLYLALTKLGPSPALQLAKTAGISRTQTYRRLEELQQAALVSSEQLAYGSLFRALPIANVEALLARREAETAAIKHNLEAMTGLFQQLAGASGPQATAQHYYGVAGLKQIGWNLTEADGEYRAFRPARPSPNPDKAFARRYRERYIENELVGYNLTNATTVYASDLTPFEPTRAHFRHIDPEILPINFEMYVYNDTVALLDCSKPTPMALEICHPALKAVMQQLFDGMWAIATPVAIH